VRGGAKRYPFYKWANEEARLPSWPVGWIERDSPSFVDLHEGGAEREGRFHCQCAKEPIRHIGQLLGGSSALKTDEPFCQIGQVSGDNAVVAPQMPPRLVDRCPARSSQPLFSSSYDGLGLRGACAQRAIGQNWSTSLKAVAGALGWGLWSYDDLVCRYRQLGYEFVHVLYGYTQNIGFCGLLLNQLFWCSGPAGRFREGKTPAR
jgi:hypothetical protein